MQDETCGEIRMIGQEFFRLQDGCNGIQYEKARGDLLQSPEASCRFCDISPLFRMSVSENKETNKKGHKKAKIQTKTLFNRKSYEKFKKKNSRFGFEDLDVNFSGVPIIKNLINQNRIMR